MPAQRKKNSGSTSKDEEVMRKVQELQKKKEELQLNKQKEQQSKVGTFDCWHTLTMESPPPVEDVAVYLGLFTVMSSDMLVHVHMHGCDV